jgi:hypothetical protein
MAKQIVQFVSILPINKVPHVVVHECPLGEMPEGLLMEDELGTFYGYADQRLYVEHEGKQVAVRLRTVEQE